MTKRNSAKAPAAPANTPAEAPAANAPAAPAANAPPVNVLANSPAPFTADTALSVAKAMVALATDTEAATATFVAKARLLASAIGCRLTFPQWDAQMLPTLKAEFAASTLPPERVTEYLSRFKMIALAFLTGDDALAPVAGESRSAYQRRVASLLSSYVFADGTPMVPPSTSGRSASGTSKRGRKAGSKASNAKAPAAPAPAAPAAPHPMSAAKADDTGLDVRPALASACILTGEDATKAHPTADLLVSVMGDAKGRADFATWARERNVALATAAANANALATARKANGAKANGASVN